MLFKEWFKENKKYYKYCEFTICDVDRKIILDDKLLYLTKRTKEYNDSWKTKCKGKNVVETISTQKGIIVVIA